MIFNEESFNEKKLLESSIDFGFSDGFCWVHLWKHHPTWPWISCSNHLVFFQALFQHGEAEKVTALATRWDLIFMFGWRFCQKIVIFMCEYSVGANWAHCVFPCVSYFECHWQGGVFRVCGQSGSGMFRRFSWPGHAWLDSTRYWQRLETEQELCRSSLFQSNGGMLTGRVSMPIGETITVLTTLHFCTVSHAWWSTRMHGAFSWPKLLSNLG